MKSETTIFVTPPKKADNDLSEEDSAHEDCTKFDLNNRGQKLLCVEAEAYRQSPTLQVNNVYVCKILRISNIIILAEKSSEDDSCIK